MGFVLPTHHKHLGSLWCLYGVHVAHPSQTSGFIMVFIWGSCCPPITNIWVHYGVYMGFVLLHFLCFLCCVFLLLFIFALCLVPIFPVSLGRPFLISPLCFSWRLLIISEWSAITHFFIWFDLIFFFSSYLNKVWKIHLHVYINRFIICKGKIFLYVKTIYCLWIYCSSIWRIEKPS
jgi:hypothetical protein